MSFHLKQFNNHLFRIMKKMNKRIIFTILLVNILSPPAILGQQDKRPNQSVPFNLRYFNFDYDVTGVRSNSLGGAFIGVADDATAATINPAGLTILTHIETSVRILIRRTESKELTGNRKKWNEKKDYPHLESDLSYANITVPFKKFTFAGYWEVKSHNINRYEYEQVITPEFNAPISLQQMLQFDGTCPGRKVYTDLQVMNFGLAGAYPFPTFRLSLGLSFQITKLDFSLSEKQYVDASLLTGEFDLKGNIAENTYSIRTIDENDWDVSYTLGLLFKPCSKFSIGIVYNKYPKLQVDSEIFYPTFFIGNSTFLSARDEDEKIILKFPDSYGIGFYYRLTDWLRISSDIKRIEYSDILPDSLASIIQVHDESGEYVRPNNCPGLKIDDATEFHVGVEYLLPLKNIKFAIRGGFYTDPFHLPYAVCDNPTLKVLFPREKDLVHFTAGFGIGIKDITIDAAAKVSTHLIECESIFSLGIRF